MLFPARGSGAFEIEALDRRRPAGALLPAVVNVRQTLIGMIT